MPVVEFPTSHACLCHELYNQCKQEARIDVLERHLIAHGDLLIDSEAPRRETEQKYAASSESLSRLRARVMIISRASATI